MTTPPNDPGGRESVPLLLVPKGPGAALEPVAERRSRTSALPPPRPSIRVASTRTGKAIGLLRSRLGAAGSLAAMMLVLCAIFADMLASDLPIVCKVHGSFFLFPNITRPADLVEMGGAEVRASR